MTPGDHRRVGLVAGVALGLLLRPLVTAYINHFTRRTSWTRATSGK